METAFTRTYWAWRKWRALVGMFVQDGLAYKANLFIWIMTDVTTAVVMPLLWLASYNGRSQIHGFSPSQMVLYYLVMLSLTGFIESHIMWDMAADVKQGRFNNYLIRPVSYLTYMYASNLGWRVMRTFLAVPLFVLVALAFRRYLPDLGSGHYHIGPAFWLSVILGHFLSFSITYALGLLSLWLYEARSLFNFYYLPLMIFSGQLAPLTLLPPIMQRFIWWTPFPYTLAFPAGVFLGKINGGHILWGFAAQIVWITLGFFWPQPSGGAVSAALSLLASNVIMNANAHDPRPLLRKACFVLLTLFLLVACTWGELRLEDALGINRPYTIFYLIPVAIGAALLGIRGGVLTALIAIILARIYIFSDNKHGLNLVSSPHVSELVEFFALLVGTLAIAVITGRLRSTLGNLHQANDELQQVNQRLTESEEQRREFNRDVLLAVTGGKLRLVESAEMPPADLVSQQPLLTQPLREPVDASVLRKTLIKLGQQAGMDAERIGDLCTATTEAATNAIKHGNGGEATVWAEGDSVTVQIEDRGTGIAPAHLARATLEQGFSTRVSLGMGFHLMLQSTDALALCTDAKGTIILLQVTNKPRPTMEDALLARYAGIV